MNNFRREFELAVISDVHLGTYGCHASELHRYLQSIKVKTLILNGDIIDFWQFSKRYWPKHHMKVVKDIINMAAKGTRVYYITGNHDETLRKFSGVRIGNIEIVNKLDLLLDGKKTWFFHGDVFDVIMQNSKWLEKLGATSYDFLILLNTGINHISNLLFKRKISLSRRIKNNVKSAVKFISHFEKTAARLAVKNKYDAIVCGHIHKPEIKDIEVDTSFIQYLNSGDWVENLTSLEYHNGTWKIYQYSDEFSEDYPLPPNENRVNIMDLDNKEIFKVLMKEFQL
jgi:UDP-2,3-diacylglucosamine pyrophosphatase LpxH